MTFLLVALTLTAATASPVPESSRQMILVVSPETSAFEGTLQRFQRVRSDAPWMPVGDPTPIVLGPSGLGAGVGLHAETLGGLPAKKEGDGRSPAGVFSLGTAFGFEASPELRMPYLKLEAPTECVDDASSSYYNRIVSRTDVDEPDWSSSERMRSIPDYVWGVVVEHNPAAKRAGGSCIFLHVWSAPGKPTAGCTAMDLDAMAALTKWLDPDAQPVLVQLTRPLFDELGAAWGLPTPALATDAP